MKYVATAVGVLFAFILGMTAVGLGFADSDAPRSRPEPVYLDAETRDVLPPTVLQPRPTDDRDDDDGQDGDRDDRDDDHSPEVVVPRPQPAQGDDDDDSAGQDSDDRDDTDDRDDSDDSDDGDDRDDDD